MINTINTKSNTKNLFNLFQKLDYRDKENSGKKKLIGILIAYLISNTAISYNFFMTFDERSFVILTLTSNLFLIALIVLNDFDNLFLASKSYEVLNVLPVKNSQFFLAKFFSAILFLLFFIFAAAVPQVIFFYFIDYDLLKTLAYILTNILFCFFAIGILLGFYIVVLIYFKDRAAMILNFFQILFFMFIFYSSTLSSRTSQNMGFFVRENILNYELMKYLPQTFFSYSVYNGFFFVLCILSSASVFILLYFLMSKKYYLLLDRVNSIKKKKSFSKPKFRLIFLKNFIQKHFLSGNYEIAGFNLVKDHLKNSKFLRIKYIPVAFLPLLFVIVGVISDSPGLLFFNTDVGTESFFKTAILVMSPSITFTLLMASRLLISNTKILDDNSSDTLWIYDSLPVKNRSIVINGANKFIYLIFIVPVTISILALLSLRADFLEVLFNILFVASGIYFINSIALKFDRTYPFTLQSSKFNSAMKFFEVFFAMFLGIILFLIQIFMFQNIIFVLITISFFIIISLLLNRNLK
ncbi:MAG: hypothetical protein M3R36_03335 [Bacteroidota bacterium]|nr:hypothetical protein [Bacteroidota bacterium]